MPSAASPALPAAPAPALRPRSRTRATCESKYRRLTRTDVGLLLRYHHDGLSQAAIAQRLGCTQQSVSAWLQRLTDTTEAAKLYLRSQALPMSERLMKIGKGADLVKTLQGLSVLKGDDQTGVQIAIGLQLPGLPGPGLPEAKGAVSVDPLSLTSGLSPSKHSLEMGET